MGWRNALEQVRNALHLAVKDLPPDEYRKVLEELSCDVEGRLEALSEEESEEAE